MNQNSDEKQDRVESYEFKPLLTQGSDIDTDVFEFKEISDLEVGNPEEKNKTIRIERTLATENNFKIAPIVREFRGINKQEQDELERRIEEEVANRVESLTKEAYSQGFQEGVEAGKVEVFQQTKAATEEKLDTLTDLINEVLISKANLLKESKMNGYETILNLTKWVILRELKDDGEYVHRLLEKLITEIQTKSNILIQIDERSFRDMPDILEVVEERLGSLSNVRLEKDFDIDGPGIVLESDNGIINGTLKEQFNNLDKLFLKVGLINENEVESFAEEFSAEPEKPEAEVSAEKPEDEVSAEVIEEDSNETSVNEDDDKDGE
tara:strand:- start:19315 stop:20286 length:972 start_codon:yes stop_codon:yes gene_type:complete